MNAVGKLGAVWGVLGVGLLLGSAVYRLTQGALASFAEPLGTVHYVAYAVSVVLMGYTEGYKAFQKQFSPRVIARARYLADHPTVTRVLLAPLFCMGFFHATKKRLIVSYALSAGVVLLIVLVRQLSQPWRGIVDVGVVFALLWGVGAMLVFAIRALKGHVMPVPADVPRGAPAGALEAA